MESDEGIKPEFPDGRINAVKSSIVEQYICCYTLIFSFNTVHIQPSTVIYTRKKKRSERYGVPVGPAGLPFAWVNLRHGIRDASREVTETNTAACGSLTLEMTVLSRLTGKHMAHHIPCQVTKDVMDCKGFKRFHRALMSFKA
jgi:hypothetical protein